ncbi:Penicillin-binding protein 1A [Serratia fonticola]|uniref:Penicillin-binding protein 1A n=1 Tax=Serratia fonticola TaxID=47917 RepID=A0A4U9WS38_SERFO|nr:Penicillin-binding protein 1A [Serratia fonticola]
MKVALEGLPEQKVTPPPGIVSVTIDKSTGKLSNGGGGSRSEYFIEGTQPTEFSVHDAGTTLTDPGGESHELFLKTTMARAIWPFFYLKPAGAACCEPVRVCQQRPCR